MSKCENLKVGDTVFVSGNWGCSLHKVEKITPKGFIKVNGALYTKDGYERGGDSWSFTTISPASPDEIEEYNKERFIRDVLKELRSVKKLSYAQAVAVNSILFDNEGV